MSYTDKAEAELDANGTPLYGLDKELAAKQAAKYDPAMVDAAKEWIIAILGPVLDPPDDLIAALKSGIVLCDLVNAIQPGICKAPSKMSAPFKQMENIGNYLEACTKLGVPAPANFQTVTLYENQNPMQVITNLHALGAAAFKAGFDGPKLGVKLADANKRDFTEEQLAAGMAQATFLGKGSHGHASQAGTVDTSKNIDKTATVKGLEAGLGINTETGLMGKGSHGQASQAGMAPTGVKEIDRMKNVQ